MPVTNISGSGRGVLCLTCDNMGSAYEVGIGMRAGPDPQEVSLTTGYPRLLELFDALGVKATFFIEGWNALHHPARVCEIVDRGHEIGLHGWVHEKFASLSKLEAERTLIDSLAAFRNIGIFPLGFRAPGGIRGQHTVEILNALGVAYDSSIDADGQANSMSSLSPQVVNIPWQWSMNDYYTYYMAPDETARTTQHAELLWKRMLDDAAKNAGLVTLTFHAMCSGADTEKLYVLERVLKHATNIGVDILTAGDLVERFHTARASL